MGIAMSVGTHGVTLTQIEGWPGWRFTVSHDGRSVSVTPPPGQVITTSKWRRMPIEAVLRTVARSGQDLWLSLLSAEAETRAPKRPRGGSPEHHKAVAYAYREALKRRLKPGEVIRAYYGGLGRTTAERWISEARQAGYIDHHIVERDRARADAQIWEDAGMPISTEGWSGVEPS